MKLLHTGAFAKLCGVRKGTLLFYDKEGVLRPKYISGNGYRRYGMDQYYEFALLSLLKDTGGSLKEIKRHLHHMDGEEFLAFLEEKQTAVKEELAALQQRKDLLRDMTTCLRASLAFAYDSLTLENHAEERLEIIPTGAGGSALQDEALQQFIDFSESLRQREEQPRYPLGSIALLEDIRQGRYRDQSYFCKAGKKTPLSAVHVKEAGLYAVMGHKGTDESHEKALADMLGRLETSGMTLTGENIYIYDMLSCVMEEGVGSITYAQKYCIGVQKESGSR